MNLYKLMKFNKYKITFFLLFFYTFYISQSTRLDTLWRIYGDKKNIVEKRLQAINDIAYDMHYINPDSAIVLSQLQIQLASENSNKKFEAGALQIIGLSYGVKSNYKTSLEYFYKSLSILEKIKDNRGIEVCYRDIGGNYESQSNYKLALEYYFKAMKMALEIGDKEGYAFSCGSVGTIYAIQSNYEKALKYYFNALNIFKKNNDQYAIGSFLGNIAAVYYEQFNNQKSLEYSFKTLEIMNQINNKYGISTCYNNIGNIFSRQNNYEIAISYFSKSLKICKEIDDEQGISTCFNNLSSIYNEMRKYKTAILYGDSALKISRVIGNIDDERLACQSLSLVYSNTGNYKLAYEYHVKFKQLTDSIFNEGNSKQLGDLKTNFEVEKKEAELKAKADAQAVITAEEKKRQQLIIYAVAGILLIVMVFSVLLFKRFRLTNKQKHIIELKEQETQKQNVIITQQKHLVEEKHKEITDSINYAERIQRAFLASDDLLNKNLNEYFVFFKPKDIVSGDFYWAQKLNNGYFALATADSTGHGVPGAIMSLLNITSIETAIKDGNTNPANILNATRKTIINRLKKDGSADGGKDGMDCSLTVYDFNNKKLFIAAANNPVWIIRTVRSSVTLSGVEGQVENNIELIEVKPDKMPVGKSDRENESFTVHTIDLQTGDTIYTLTDGFPDQFGGPNGKKFMSKKLKELLIANAHLSMLEQKQILDTTFKNWVGYLEQVDDVCIVGIRI